MSAVDGQDVWLDHVHQLDYPDSCIPKRIQKGFSVQDIDFTCVSATETFLALGTNVGIGYLVDRRDTGMVQRLRCEGSTHPLTCILCLDTVDLMVAIGTSAGLVMIFQIPLHEKENCDSVFSAQQLQHVDMKRYLVTELHHRPITCLRWSPNGMKLFSGDSGGMVACTEMDYVLRQSRSSTVLEEPDPIVSIDYRQRLVLVSTKRRTLLCTPADNTDVVVSQVGVKERKILGSFGAMFYVTEGQELFIFACRPSLRLWKANTDGKVLETFIFKDDRASPTCALIDAGYDSPGQLIADFAEKGDCQFEHIGSFDERHLVTWNSRHIYIICIAELRMVVRCEGLGSIGSVASCTDEIFVLNGPRSVIRIANSPDYHRPSALHNADHSSVSVLPVLRMVPNSLKELESKWRDSNVKASIFGKWKSSTKPGGASSVGSVPMKHNICESDVGTFVDSGAHDRVMMSSTVSEEEDLPGDQNNLGFSVGSARDRALELPDVQWTALDEDDEDKEDEMGIVFERKAAKRNRKRISHVGHEGSEESVASQSPEFTPAADSRPKFGVSDVPVAASASTVAEKEQLLAKMLNIDELFPLGSNGMRNSGYVPNVDKSDVAQPSSEPLDFQKLIEEELAIRGTVRTASNSVTSRLLSSCSVDYEDIYNLHCEDDDYSSLSSVPESYLSYGPPSGSSTMPSIGEAGKSLVPNLSLPALGTDASKAAIASSVAAEQESPRSLPTKLSPDVAPNNNVNPTFGVQWIQHRCPKYVQSLAVCEQYAICTDVKDFVYYSALDGMGLDWHKMDYMAKQVSISSSGKRVWRIHNNTVYTLVGTPVNKLLGTKWIEVADNMGHVAVDDSCVWMVTQKGKVMASCELDDTRSRGGLIPVSCPWNVAQVACYDDVVWILTGDGRVACRVGVSGSHALGSKWSLVDFGTSHVFTISLGMPSFGWVVDESYNIWFKSGLAGKVTPKGTDKKWWQVKISDYVYQTSSALQTFTSALKDSLNPDQLTSLLRSSGNLCLVVTQMRGVWFYNPNDGRLFATNGPIIGHHWHSIDLSRRVRMTVTKMTASGIYHNYGGIWLWDGTTSVHYFNPTSMSVHSVRLPEGNKENPLLCLSAAPETLWILLDSGCVYIRKGITIHHSTGSEWVSLDLAQIANHKLVHLSCGLDVVWACDNQGCILMRIGSLQAPATNGLPPAWVPVIDDQPTTLNAPFFVKVYVGPTSYTVWAIDAKRNVYVREGIFSDLLIGIGWVLVSGVQAVGLAISEQAVYAVTSSGAVYRRYNITASNYIGDYWRELPGPSSLLSVSVNDHLWGIDRSGRLQRHLTHVIPGPVGAAASLPTTPTNSNEPRNSVTEEEWEIVEFT